MGDKGDGDTGFDDTRKKEPQEVESAVEDPWLLPWGERGLVPGFWDYVASHYGEEDAVEAAHEGVELTEYLLADALAIGATDIHIDPRDNGTMVRLRLDGVLKDTVLLDAQLALILGNQVKILAEINPLPAFGAADGHFFMVVSETSLNVRVTVASVMRGDKLSMRLLVQPEESHDLTALGMQEDDLQRVERCRRGRAGIMAVAGPIGSGKTTTLYGLIRELDTATGNIVTIEDPVETEIKGINQMQVDEKQGMTFPEGLKAMLRLDPDFLVLGEIREPESARLAVDAVISGRRLLCTLHSRDAVATVTTLRNFGLSSREIATNLVLVISQRLLRRLCGQCARREAPTREEQEWYEWVGEEPPAEVSHAVGCEECHHSGYRGRQGIFEIWVLNREDVGAIIDGADEQELRRRLLGRGHRFLLTEGLQRIADGVTTVDEIANMGGYELGMES
ncbi:MAG: ATPase, T2SS/T4P/T4SS family [Gammaproteobacteria bacterium]|nr:ATPase, T2SS/T4P/T4SS family [Gammaproteobacteria bacterium]